MTGVNLKLSGNLVVDGTTTSVNSETTNMADNHLYLNSGYTTVAAQTGGLSVNYLPTATVDTVVAGAFVAGVASTSNPTVTTSAATVFSVGDLIQISGTNNNENDGVYEVLSHAANVLTIRGVGTDATVEDFTGNQFIANGSDSATITKVTVSVLRSGIDGLWETASGSATGLTFVDIVDISTTQGLTNKTIVVEDNTLKQTTPSSGDYLKDNGTKFVAAVFATDVAATSSVTANTAKISYTDAAAVTANTAKVTNATHTGDVTGSTTLTLASGVVGLSNIANAAKTESISIALGDESTVLDAASTSVPVVTYHMPYGFTLTDVKAGLTVAGTGAALVTVDVHEAGTTVLSTKVTIDATEKTSGTAATPVVISDSALAEDSLIEIFVDLIDTNNIAAGLKVYLIGFQT